MRHFYLAFFAAMGFGMATAEAQIAASFTISHAGLQPSSEATVNVGDTVKFIHGGGGPHPMTSGHNQTPSPTFFPTVSVTIGAPEATFALEEAGVYFFHCGTNPMNSNNWGTLTVVDPLSPNLDPDMHVYEAGLQLSEQDKLDLVAFMESFTDGSFLTNEAFSAPQP